MSGEETVLDERHDGELEQTFAARREEGRIGKMRWARAQCCLRFNQAFVSKLTLSCAGRLMMHEERGATLHASDDALWGLLSLARRAALCSSLKS
jgi:hypothetical protein